MMHDMGVELRKHGVAAISLWPGPVRTETLKTVEDETAENADLVG